jgi:glycosidase
LARVLMGDADALALALLLQFTLPGAPSIYYGDEIGLAGGMDPDCREAMPWDQPGGWDAARLAFVRELASLRGAHPALRTGETTVAYARRGVVAIRRRSAGDDLLLVLNQRSEDAHARVPLAGVAAGPRVPLFGTVAADVEGEAAVMHVRLPARAGAVLAL